MVASNFLNSNYLLFVNETIVGEVIVDEMNQTDIYFYITKFTILIGQFILYN